MAQLDELRKQLKQGKVYRRADLLKWSNAVDRHLEELVSEGTLEKLSAGVYHYPATSVFGKVPPDETDLITAFLKDDRFLLFSPNLYNSLGVGTTQLYNQRLVYNHKRHGVYMFGNKIFEFHLKHHFPKKVTEEFLLVDLVNNIDDLAEDKPRIMYNVTKKVNQMNSTKLKKMLMYCGSIRTKKFFNSLGKEKREHV